MSVITRLIQMVREATEPEVDPALSLDVSDDRLASAALLVHVARVDGAFDPAERRALVEALASGYGLTSEAAEALVERADRFDREVDDVAGLVEMLGHETYRDDRRRLLATACTIAAADGSVGEFESDLLWRMGRLLGFDDLTIDEIRSPAGAPAAGR